MSDEATPFIIFFGFILFSIGLLYFLFRRATIKKEILLKNLPPPTKKGFLGNEKGEGELDGIAYQYEYCSGGDHSPPYFKLSVDSPSAPPFRIGKKRRFDRLAAKLGIIRAIKTGESDFDDKFHISSDSAQSTEHFFRDEKNRHAVEEISDAGFNHIQHNSKTLSAIWMPLKTKQPIPLHLIRRVITALTFLCKELPEDFEKKPILWQIQNLSAFLIPLIISAIGGVCFAIAMFKYRPLDPWLVVLDSLKYSIPATIIFVWSAVWLLKGRASSHRILVGVSLTTLLGFVFGGIGLEVYLNGYLDKSPARSHYRVVVSKYSRKREEGTDYFARVKSWRNGKSTEKILVGKSLYDSIIVGKTTIRFETKPGKFGFEWFTEHRIRRE